MNIYSQYTIGEKEKGGNDTSTVAVFIDGVEKFAFFNEILNEYSANQKAQLMLSGEIESYPYKEFNSIYFPEVELL